MRNASGISYHYHRNYPMKGSTFLKWNQINSNDIVVNQKTFSNSNKENSERPKKEQCQTKNKRDCHKREWELIPNKCKGRKDNYTPNSSMLFASMEHCYSLFTVYCILFISFFIWRTRRKNKKKWSTTMVKMWEM